MAKVCTIVIEDEVNCRIGGLHPADLKAIWDKFGFYAEGYRFRPAFQLKKWDGKIRWIDTNGKTYTKLLEEIIPHIINWNYDIQFDDKRINAVITETIDADFFGHSEIKLRSYQVEAANKLLAHGSGFGVLATSAGKTLLCAAMAQVLKNHGLSTVIIVPSQDLVSQTVNELTEVLTPRFPETTIGSYSGGVKQIDCHIVVATWQSLQHAPHLMLYFQAVIVDECHGVKANIVRDLINTHGGHINFRWGITGTFPKEKNDQYALKSSIGDVLIEVPASELIRLGYLSTLEIQPIETLDKTGEEFPDWASEKSYLSKYDERLETIAGQIKNYTALNGNSLVLVSSIEQGRKLSNLIEGSVFLSGESDKKLRALNYAEFADRDDTIVIATAGIASTGISINRVFNLFMIDIGKSFTRSIQSIGRSLRKKGDKMHAYVFDFYSNLKFGRKHFKDRKSFYVEARYPVKTTIKLPYTKQLPIDF